MRAPGVSHAAMAALGWKRVDPRPWGKLDALWIHSSGWKIQHCGHPTAHQPWILLDPAGEMVLTGVTGPHRRRDFGTAWPRLLEPAQWVATNVRRIPKPETEKPK